MCAAHYPLGVREAIPAEPMLSLSALNHTVLLWLSVTHQCSWKWFQTDCKLQPTSYFLFHNLEKEWRAFTFILLIQRHDAVVLFDTRSLFLFLASPWLCTTDSLRDAKNKNKNQQLAWPTTRAIDCRLHWHLVQWLWVAWRHTSALHFPETDPGNWKLLTSGRG